MPDEKPKKKPCGPHVELASNPAARVMRCACGTVHVHLHAQGVSLRLPPDVLRAVANALAAAANVVDVGEVPPLTTAGDDTVN
ncbi:MAG: hypothetical protein NVS3B10_07290 [Polyangiales bacterium]